MSDRTLSCETGFYLLFFFVAATSVTEISLSRLCTPISAQLEPGNLTDLKLNNLAVILWIWQQTKHQPSNFIYCIYFYQFVSVLW
jgi:hypothetical protein